MTNRRQILGLSAAVAGGIAADLFSAAIRRGLAIPALRETRSIRDVKHVVILMMENRGFDHYLRTLCGVRAGAGIGIVCGGKAESGSGSSRMASARSRLIPWTPPPPAPCACRGRR